MIKWQLLLLKTAVQAQVGKIKLYINFYATLQAPAKRKTEKQTKGSYQRLTAPLNPSNIPLSNIVQGRSFHTRVWAGRKHRANCYVLHIDTSNSNGRVAAAARVCRTLTEADGSSLNKQWFEFELTLYNIHSATTWRRWHGKKVIWAKPDHRIHLALEKLKMTFISRPLTGEQYSRIGRTIS